MSNSMQPYGLQPTRLLCPWDSPGKNTGVGCHALLQRIFPTQGLNPLLLHCRWLLYLLSHLGTPPRKYLLLSKLTSEYHFHIRYRQGTEGLLNLWRPQQTLKCRGKAFVAFNSRNSVYPHNYVGFNCIVSKNAVKS